MLTPNQYPLTFVRITAFMENVFLISIFMKKLTKIRIWGIWMCTKRCTRDYGVPQSIFLAYSFWSHMKSLDGSWWRCGLQITHFSRISFLLTVHQIHDDQHFLVLVSCEVPMQKVRKKAFVATATENVAWMDGYDITLCACTHRWRGGVRRSICNKHIS